MPRRPFRRWHVQIIGCQCRASTSLTTRGPPSSPATTSPDDQAQYSLTVARSDILQYSQQTIRKQFLLLLPATPTAKPAGLLPYPRYTIHGAAILHGPPALPKNPTVRFPLRISQCVGLPTEFRARRLRDGQTIRLPGDGAGEAATGRRRSSPGRRTVTRWPRLKDGIPLLRAADGRLDFEQICIRFDD